MAAPPARAPACTLRPLVRLLAPPARAPARSARLHAPPARASARSCARPAMTCTWPGDTG